MAAIDAFDLAPGIGAGGITTTMLHDGAVTAVKLGDDAVTAAALDTGSVTADALAAGAVGASALAALATTFASFAHFTVGGTTPTPIGVLAIAVPNSSGNADLVVTQKVDILFAVFVNDGNASTAPDTTQLYNVGASVAITDAIGLASAPKGIYIPTLLDRSSGHSVINASGTLRAVNHSAVNCAGTWIVIVASVA